MSPLTPTLPQTQTLIPAGPFAHLPNFATKVQEALDLVNPSDKEVVNQKKQEIEQQKAHLTSLIEDLKFSQKEYDFFDYEERLLLSDAEIENILENEIFRKYGKLNEIGKGFYKYLDVLTEGMSEELKGKMKRKLVKELKLENRIYESSGNGVGGKNGGEKRIKFDDKEQFFQDIQYAGESGILSLDLSYNRLYEQLDASEFITLVQEAGRSGIRILDIADNSLSEQLDASGFITLVQEAGRSGLRSLDLGDDDRLSKKLDAPDIITLVQEAGRSGLRSLNFRGNKLSKKLDAPDFITLVQGAGHSGLKSLNFYSNELSKKLEAQDFITLVQEAGHSGLRSLNFRANRLSRKLNILQKQELDDITKRYNMKLNYSE